MTNDLKVTYFRNYSQIEWPYHLSFKQNTFESERDSINNDSRHRL